MTNQKYAKAYVEILEMLKYLPEHEYDKIPKEKINFFEKNKDITYRFSLNPNIPLEDQDISVEANSIIVALFRDYFANDTQKEILEKILIKNENKYQEEIREKYNPDNIFKNRQNISSDFNNTESTALIEFKEKNFLQKIFDKIKNLFNRKK